MNISEDTAAVLAGLVRGIDNWYGDPVALTDKLAGLREARHLLRSLGLYSGLKPAQAATGARAAGGESDRDETYRELRSAVDGELKLAGIYLDRDAEDIITEALIEHAEAAQKVECPDCAQWSWHGPDAERKVIEHYLLVHAAPPTSKPLLAAPSSAAVDERVRPSTARRRLTVMAGYLCEPDDSGCNGMGCDIAGMHHPECGLVPMADLRDVYAALTDAAPPAPVAHGVAELLAACDRIERESRGFDDVVSTRKIRRLLAPGGADATEAGT